MGFGWLTVESAGAGQFSGRPSVTSRDGSKPEAPTPNSLTFLVGQPRPPFFDPQPHPRELGVSEC